jgi:hypothetical protein
LRLFEAASKSNKTLHVSGKSRREAIFAIAQRARAAAAVVISASDKSFRVIHYRRLVWRHNLGDSHLGGRWFNGSILVARKSRDTAEIWAVSPEGGDEKRIVENRHLDPTSWSYDVSSKGQVVYVHFKPGKQELWMTDFH